MSSFWSAGIQNTITESAMWIFDETAALISEQFWLTEIKEKSVMISYDLQGRVIGG